MQREIAFDTETTGLDPASGHRIVEIGCVEMLGRIRTGKVFHAYLNPERDVPEEACRVHGLDTKFLKDKPLFPEVVDDFLEFIMDSPLVIHNAGFDMKFINFELSRTGNSALSYDRAVDTMLIARKKFPGAPASLDALCKRFSIDLSSRSKHGALLDAELLADVYLELMGGRQDTFDLTQSTRTFVSVPPALKMQGFPIRAFPTTAEELLTHNALLQKIKNSLWEKV